MALPYGARPRSRDDSEAQREGRGEGLTLRQPDSGTPSEATTTTAPRYASRRSGSRVVLALQVFDGAKVFEKFD